MTKKMLLTFENGLPRTTSQQKGDAIRTNALGQKYIHHYRKAKVQNFRTMVGYQLKRYAPAKPSEAPIRLTVFVGFDVKNAKLWGQYKTTRPDGDNYIKEIKDVMTRLGFWLDDAQVVDERIVRHYSEKGTITIQIDDLKQPIKVTV
jgi:Holliday junction resolvase RusA-like endonuclease